MPLSFIKMVLQRYGLRTDVYNISGISPQPFWIFPSWNTELGIQKWSQTLAIFFTSDNFMNTCSKQNQVWNANNKSNTFLSGYFLNCDLSFHLRRPLPKLQWEQKIAKRRQVGNCGDAQTFGGGGYHPGPDGHRHCCYGVVEQFKYICSHQFVIDWWLPILQTNGTKRNQIID